jgi:hypothetical protein
MPNKVIKAVSEKTGHTPAELEAIWNKAIEEAKKRGVKNYYAYANAVIQGIKRKSTNDAQSLRYVDDNGALICPKSIITGADVAQYWGFEIPNNKAMGLEDNKIYNVYRPIDEITDNDFNGKYLLDRHLGDFSADTFNKYKNNIIGTVYDCTMENNEIIGTVAFNDPKAVDALDDGKRCLSAGYFYDPVMEQGAFNGMPYDIKMTNIRANHIAHVDNPRYKRALVGDEQQNIASSSATGDTNAIKVVTDADLIVAKQRALLTSIFFKFLGV